MMLSQPDSSEPQPFVTVVVTTSDDEPRIEACLRSILAQEYPVERMEVLVADAMSMDATREIVLRLAAEDKRIRLLDNPDRTRSAALNLMVPEGRGDVVVPMDPCGYYAQNHVARCVEGLMRTEADELDVVPRPSGGSLLAQALELAERSRLAFAHGFGVELGSKTLPVALGAVRRRVLARVGALDSGACSEEEAELARRVRRTGGIIAIGEDIVVHKFEADATYSGLFRKHFRLGRSRARRVLSDGRVPSLHAIAPFLMVLGGSALVLTSTVQPLSPVALASYALLTGAAAVRVSRGEGLAILPLTWAAFPLMHLAQGAGFATTLVVAAGQAAAKTSAAANLSGSRLETHSSV